MNAEQIRELQGARPFQPFTIHMSDGRSFDVPHPELLFVTRRYVMVGTPHRGGIPDDVQRLNLLHVTSIDDMHAAPS